MGKLIRVKPAAGLRREFARWARRHQGVRTVSHAEIGLPPHVFAEAPERLLIGALVDSRPYVPRPAAPPRARVKSQPAVVTTAAPAVAGVEPTVTDPEAPLPDGAQPPDDADPVPVATAVAGADHVVMGEAEGTVDETGPAVHQTDPGELGAPLVVSDGQLQADGAALPGGSHDDDLADTTEPTFACTEPGCGFTSRSDRGLRIHQSRTHSGGGE